MSSWKAYFLVLLATLPILFSFFPLNTGFPLDDSWIFTVFAGNLRESGQWAYNPGEPCAGVTSLAWTWLLSLFAGDSDLPFYPQLTSAYALAILLCFYPIAGALPHLFKDSLEGSQRFRKWAAVLLSILTLSHGMWFFHLLSGMETCVFVSTGVLALVFHQLGRRWFAGLALAFLVLLRSEGYLLAVVLGVHGLLTDHGIRCSARSFVKTLVSPLSLCANLALGAVLIHNWRFTGTPFPATFAGRRFLFQLDPDRLEWEKFGEHFVRFVSAWLERLHDWYWMDNFLPGAGWISLPGGLSVHPLALILDLAMGLGALVVFVRLFDSSGWGRKTPLSLLAAWTLVHNLFYVVVLPTGGHAGRYQAINYLWPPLLVAIGGQEFFRFLSRFVYGFRPHFARSRFGVWGTTLAILLGVVPWFSSLGIWNEVLVAGIDRINGLHQEAGLWSKKNLPSDSRVVAFDLGAYKMTSGLYIVDQSGLLDDRGLESFRKHNSPEFYRERKATHLFRFLRLGEPDPTFDPVWETALEREFEVTLHEEIGIDREACQNTWSRCAVYRIVYLDE